MKKEILFETAYIALNLTEALKISNYHRSK